jgi:hypothetical protein
MKWNYEVCACAPLHSIPLLALYHCDDANIALPAEFFASPLQRKIYQDTRNYMVEAYRSNPRIYLSVQACRAVINGDGTAISRIHTFLEQSGIINYQVDPGTAPLSATIWAATSNNYPVVSQTPHRSFVRLRQYHDDYSSDSDSDEDTANNTNTSSTNNDTLPNDAHMENEAPLTSLTPAPSSSSSSDGKTEASPSSTLGQVGAPRPRSRRRREPPADDHGLRPLRDLVDHDLFDGGNFYLRRNIFMSSVLGSANSGDYMSRVPAGARSTCAACSQACTRVKYQLKQRREYNICAQCYARGNYDQHCEMRDFIRIADELDPVCPISSSLFVVT